MVHITTMDHPGEVWPPNAAWPEPYWSHLMPSHMGTDRSRLEGAVIDTPAKATRLRAPMVIFDAGDIGAT